MNSDLIYLDTYVLQQDMRIRLPKLILENLKVTKGVSKFDIYLDKKNNQIIFKINEKEQSQSNCQGDKNGKI